ncbi:hypothetical protein CHGG_09769 [Chaetomium globosum CBS 148.51]|uniref:Tyrosinase copper-binding domain-containing protein n=1 Tax=Chaetomium globosum (strain ATCC 6205 / CBS 148.51 / DSM 1962 / NBRC 6347 / NRRL 1970) TaxID=306901 RepID=Q2GQI5_CHAGB|nr:uncharacterized protein CHGG_09769 [Chaetomium globosum CBS 148.51]EAQ83365.1 hypothetical protein CHGG_09769 [Chaetomium globosum CBS 148.51]
MVALKQSVVFALIASVLGASVPKVPQLSDFTPAQIENGKALSELAKLAYKNTDPKIRCKGGSLLIPLRRTLSKKERKEYIAAVQCLRTKPSLLGPATAPGAKSLFDDFVAIHLMQTMNIHLSGIFLTWHRYYTWAYEEKLRTECNYRGTVPYWEWGLDIADPAASPVFDGSDTSLGGNGDAIPHEGLILTEPFNAEALIPLPAGSGGGCVTTGPFANMTVHIGPVALAQYGTTDSVSSENPLGDNSRCLKRDLNAGVASRYTSFLNTTTLILENPGIERFQGVMQGDPRYVRGELGVHGGGHFTIGGDPGADPFISSGDPAFFLHHSQIDRVYWIWQMLDLEKRKDVFGTQTFLDMPPSPNVTLDDIIDISPLAPPIRLGDLMNTVGGSPFCYVYL